MGRLIAQLAAALTLQFLIAVPGWAQSYPAKPVRIISPYAPGGGNYILARIISGRLGEGLGQQVIIDSRPGANGIIGTELAARSAPDGYTLILVPTGHASNPSLYPKLPYDAIQDFTPISLVGSGPLLLVVHPSLPVKSVGELISLARSKPGELTYGTAGNGSSGHLAGVLFAMTAGVKLTHVPYKGNAIAVTDLLGGQVTMMFGTTLSVLPHARAGRLRPLAMTSDARSAAALEIPTVAESGVPGYSAGLWYGLLAPAKTPREIVERLNSEIGRVLKLPDVREKLLSQGVDPRWNTPEEFARLIASDLEKWAKVIRASGVRID